MNTRGHRFGGPWTEQKLECVSKYLCFLHGLYICTPTHKLSKVPRTKTPLLTLGM